MPLFADDGDLNIVHVGALQIVVNPSCMNRNPMADERAHVQLLQLHGLSDVAGVHDVT